MNNRDIIGIDVGEYRLLSEKFEFMTEDDTREIPKYILTTRKNTIKKIFSDGEEMSPQNITELKRIGIEVVSEKNHYKLVYKNSKYWFTVSKTPSDKRGGKNLASDITRRLSVYK